MIGWLLIGAGLVLVFEGLVLALMPGRIEEALEFLVRLPVETRRLLGLLALTIGTLLLWAARTFGL